jgi:hypothetical protein
MRERLVKVSHRAGATLGQMRKYVGFRLSDTDGIEAFDIQGKLVSGPVNRGNKAERHNE